jgi:hypothetical protein
VQPTEEQQQEFSQQDIGGVVQDVISQFLNGSLSDSHFRSRRSRKRRSRRGERMSAGGDDSLVDCPPPTAKMARLSLPTSRVDSAAEDLLLADEHGVLNLSLPKPSGCGGLKVTFALEDKCYAEDGTARFYQSARTRLDEPATSHNSDGFLAAAPAAGSGPVVVRPGVIAMPPVRLLQKSAGTTASSCVHFAGGSGHPASTSYLNNVAAVKPAATLYSSRKTDNSRTFLTPSGSLAFSSVIKSVQAAVTPTTTAAAGCSVVQSTLSMPVAEVASTTADNGGFSVNKVGSVKATITTATSAPSLTSVSRREVIVKFSAEKSKSSESSSAAGDAAPAGNSAAAAVCSGSSSSNNSSTNREMHNRLEKNRRAHLKHCFDELAAECELDARKSSNLTVIKSALKYIMVLRRKEREHEKELADLVQEKIRRQQLLAQLKSDLPSTPLLQLEEGEDTDCD